MRQFPSLSARLSGPQRAILGGVLTCLTLSALTVWAWTNASAEAMRMARDHFAFKASEVRFAIEQRLLAYEHVLRGGVALFAASDEVTREEWRTYVGTLQIEQRYPGIQGVGFAKRVLPGGREAHLRAVRAEGFPDYRMWPQGERDEYTSIIYLEPFDWRNQRAFGYDMYAEPVRREAMARARDSGRPAASGKVTLVQETGKDVQSGFLMYLPVYAHAAPLSSAEQRREALQGYVYAPFRMNDLMRGILGAHSASEIDIDIHDGADLSSQTLLYDSEHEHFERRHESALSLVAAIEFGGRNWTLHLSSLPAFDANIDVQKPRLILAGGILVSVLFGAVVWALGLNRSRARELAVANRGLEAEIAERTKLERELERARDTAEAANQAKSEFLANVSHELRTPLTLILAPLDALLHTDAPAADRRAQLARIERNALLLLNRVNDILDFSKAEAGRFEPRCEVVDLVALIAGIAEDAAAAARAKCCTLTWQSDPALAAVSLDRELFERILLNLLANALKFTGPGGEIRVEAVVLHDARFMLSVTDTGIGIAADKLPLLFRRFQQVDSSATRRAGGTGIGLALVKELAELMGGCVGVDSEPGRGSRFFVELPHICREGAAEVVTDEAADARQNALRRARFDEAGGEVAQAAGEPLALGSALPCVLVADDNADMRAYVAELLRDECRVLLAADGEQAWSLLQHHGIDLVVSDVMMPVLDGLGLAARIKASADLSHVPVILLTARGGQAASASGLESGADDYLAKPFSPLELKARVRAALRMGRVQRVLRDKSREAGMALIAAGMLHNLGNILNGVTVSSGLIRDQLHCSRLPRLRQLASLLQQHAGELPAFFARPQAQMLPAFLDELCTELEAERDALLGESADLRLCVEHACGILADQQRIARTDAQLRELVAVDALMEAALRLAKSAFDLRDVAIERDYAWTGSIAVDRHKVLQILLNLLANACDALRRVQPDAKRLRVRTVRVGDRVQLEVSDNGAGIDAQDLPRLFDQSFTTHEEPGHGLGLHSSANWARTLGGTLCCSSEGRGRGACFRLVLPLSSLEPGEHADSTIPVPCDCE